MSAATHFVPLLEDDTSVPARTLSMDGPYVFPCNLTDCLPSGASQAVFQQWFPHGEGRTSIVQVAF